MWELRDNEWEVDLVLAGQTWPAVCVDRRMCSRSSAHPHTRTPVRTAVQRAEQRAEHSPRPPPPLPRMQPLDNTSVTWGPPSPSAFWSTTWPPTSAFSAISASCPPFSAHSVPVQCQFSASSVSVQCQVGCIRSGVRRSVAEMPELKHTGQEKRKVVWWIPKQRTTDTTARNAGPQHSAEPTPQHYTNPIRLTQEFFYSTQ